MKYAVLNLPRLSDAEPTYRIPLASRLRHPLFAWLGLRPVLAQHTEAENATFRRWAAGRSNLVEIGVAEGVSALAVREVMSETGTMCLIDPFHLSRVRPLNFMKRAAHRAVNGCRRGKVVWVEKFSAEAAKSWNRSIDFLLIDGDHSATGVRKDWDDWSGFVEPGGVVLFHDARVFEGGWTNQAYGPVRLVNELFREDRIKGWKIVEEVHSVVAVEKQEEKG